VKTSHVTGHRDRPCWHFHHFPFNLVWCQTRLSVWLPHILSHSHWRLLLPHTFVTNVSVSTDVYHLYFLVVYVLVSIKLPLRQHTKKFPLFHFCHVGRNITAVTVCRCDITITVSWRTLSCVCNTLCGLAFQRELFYQQFENSRFRTSGSSEADITFLDISYLIRQQFCLRSEGKLQQ
jgi:hypothetical protein